MHPVIDTGTFERDHGEELHVQTRLMHGRGLILHVRDGKLHAQVWLMHGRGGELNARMGYCTLGKG